MKYINTFHSKLKIWTQALLFALPFLAMAQTTTIIEGTVLDDNQTPLLGAQIYFQNKNEGVISDFDGKFRLETTSEGTVTLVIQSLGFTSYSEQIELSGGTITKNVQLETDILGLDEIIVTGNTNPKSKLESSIAISSVGLKQIQNSGARGTAELYKTIPGLFVNASGGEGNANIEIRGNPSNGGGKFVQIQEDGLPVLPYGDIMFGNTDMFTRLDNTIRTVETIRGGSAAILNSNSGGGIINNISKAGTEKGGSISTEVGLDYSHFRTDYEYGTPLGDDARFHIGGFYRTNEGIRPAGYTANQGGQVKANFTKDFDKGYVRLYFKHLDDKTIPYIPIPLARKGDPNSNRVEAESLPGFSGTHGTFHSVDLLRFKAASPNGGFVEESLQDGMNPVVLAYGAEFNFDLGDNWRVKNKLRNSNIDHQFNGIFSFSGAPQSAEDFATDRGLTDYTYSYVSGFGAGEAISDNALETLNGNGLVVEYGYWNVDLDMDYFVNDLSVNKRFEDINANLTLGYFHSQFNLESEWWWHNFLADISDNTRRLNLVDNSTGESLTVNGFSQFGTLYKSYQAESNINAPYVNFEIEPIENLNVSVGARLDIGSIAGQTNAGTGGSFDYDVDGDGTISAAETGVLHNDGNFIPFSFDYEQFSYSIGVNYKFTDNFASFLRHSQGARYNFDRAFAFNATTDTRSGYPTFEEDGERIIQYELGLKYKSPILGVFVTGFHTRYPDDNFQELTFDNQGNSILRQSQGLIKVTGVEIDAKAAYENFSLGFNGTFFDRRYGDRVVDDGQGGELDLSGEQTPGVNSFFTITPAYETKNKKFFANSNIIWRGRLDNLDTDDTYFPAYTSVNASVGVRLGKVTLSVNGSNIFNVIGIDEGNPRSIASPVGQNAFFARPLLGRSFLTRVAYQF